MGGFDHWEKTGGSVKLNCNNKKSNIEIMTFTLALIAVKILFACFDRQNLTAVGAKRLQRKAGKAP